METLTAQEAAQNILKLAALAKRDGCHFLITADEGNMVLLSEETYHNIIVTLELLATPGLLGASSNFANSLDFEEMPE